MTSAPMPQPETGPAVADTPPLGGSLLRALVESAVDGIVMIDEHGTIQSVNPATERLFGYQAEELLGHNISMLMPEPHHSRHDGYLAEYLRSGRRRIIGIGREVEGLRKDSSVFPMHLSVSEVADGQRRLFAGVVRDLSERERAARALLRARAYLRDIIDSMPSVLVGVDRDGRVTEWSRRAAELTGQDRESALGRPCAELFPFLDALCHAVPRAIDSHTAEPRVRLIDTRPDGETRHLDVRIYPLTAPGTEGAVVQVDDVTQQVRLEQLLVQTEKMVTVGGLAAGMAHEINNPLSAVLQGCQNALRRLSPDLDANRTVAAELGLDLTLVQEYLQRRGVLRFLDGIHEAASRASRIVVDMLGFSRRPDAHLVPVRLEDLLETVMRLAVNDYDLKKKHDIRLVQVLREYDPELGPVFCDPTEIEQVFLNIVKNAAQAMSAAAGTEPPRITLRTRRDGDFARVEIEDNGPGMDEKVRQHVFEPFFTTKPAGIGTGLGLSVSHYLATERHGGTLSVESQPGAGAQFILRLPIAGQRRS